MLRPDPLSFLLKNLMGVLNGFSNKRVMHRNISKNINHLNQSIQPNLHIVDGLFGMEGDGPSKGTPVHYDKILVASDPYFLDYLCARLIDYPPEKVKLLKAAMDMGFITNSDRNEWDMVDIQKHIKPFKKPNPNPIAAFCIDPRFRKKLMALRATPPVNFLCNTNIVKNMFYISGISQEKLNNEDADIYFELDSNKCTSCGKCSVYCPLELSLEKIKEVQGKDCLGCLYCFSVCPESAIQLEGLLA